MTPNPTRTKVGGIAPDQLYGFHPKAPHGATFPHGSRDAWSYPEAQ